MNRQINKPQKGKRHDPVWKVYYKHDGCSMRLFKGLTFSGAYARVKTLKTMWTDWNGNFVITK